MRTSNNEHDAHGALVNGYDYGRQCWIIDGLVAACGHPQRVATCYACNHAGEQIDNPADNEDMAPAQGIARPSAVDMARVWLRDIADLIADPDDVDTAALETLADGLRALEIPAYLVAVTTEDDEDDEDGGDYFTTCDYCGLLNIPIIDDMAPEFCESCDPGDNDTTGGK